MLKKIKQLLANHLIFWLSLMIFLAGTFAMLGWKKHLSFNLEPYPDGLFYTVPAWSLVNGGELSVEFAGSTIPNIVPPLYSLLLVPFYLVFPTPVAFYLLNVVLGSLTIVFLYLSFKEQQNFKQISWLLPLFSLLPLVLWLPSLPMSDNLLITIATAIVWLWLTKKTSVKNKIILLPLLQLLAFLTKYSSFGFLAAFNLIFLWQLSKNKQREELGKYIVILAGLFGSFLLLAKPSYILKVFQPQTETKTSSELVAFSASYFWKNFIAYLKAVLGFADQLVWQRVSLFFYGLLILPLLVIKKSQEIKTLIIFILLTTSLQVFFYSIDIRYIATILPLMMLAVGKSLSLIPKEQLRLSYLAIGVSLLSFILFHQGFYRELIATNWLNRSRAWQYEAVTNLQELDLESDSYLITALPPYLFSFYYPNHPHILPLSDSQEFMNEGQRPWGDSVDYKNLLNDYRSMIDDGQKLYLSNAYITHQQSVVEDYESYKDEFGLELVLEGCLGACNLYLLSL